MSQFVTAIGSAPTDEAEQDLARRIQSTVVPGTCSGWPGTRIAARRIASGAPGGDFHDVIRGVDERCSLVAGTITGQGLSAAMAKAVMSSAIRTLGPISRSPRVLVDRVNRLLNHINADLGDQRVACSLFYGLVHRAEGTLEFCNAGRFRPIAWTRKGELRDLGSTGPALGSSTALDCASEPLDLASLQRLIIYSEGLTTARSPLGESIGAARGPRLLTDRLHLPVDEQVDAALQALRNHVGRDGAFADDVTVFVAEFADEEAASRGDSTRDWFRTYERAVGAVPDSSVFLG